MKKFLALTLVVLALVFALASCGGDEQVTTTTTTTTTQPPVHIHNYAEWEIIQEPTCTEKGVKVRYCSCGEKQSEVVLALGHTPADSVEENRVEATCYAEGSYDNVVYCSTCKAELERASYTLSKVEHTPASAVEENRVEPTHEKDGSYQMVVYCSVAECHAELERTTHTLDMLVHHPGNVVVENQVAATCTSNGSYDEVVYCLDDDCGHKELSRKTVSVPMIEHTPAEAVEENRVEATCTANGSYDEVVYCANCGAQISRITKVIDATGHNEVVDPAVDATCTETGLTEGKHCSSCDFIIVSQTTVAKLSHGFGDWVVVKESTTTEEGLKERTCECGEKETEIIAKLTYSKGLEFTLNEDEQSYSVVGIGTCTDIDVIIPNTYNGLPVTALGIRAFEYCTSFTSITIPDSVTSIEYRAFMSCYSLTSITIPDSVTSIVDEAFLNCFNLVRITIGESVTRIAYNAFEGCYSLIEVCNKSSLNIRIAYGDHGRVGYYAKHIVTDETQSFITFVGEYVFYDDGTNIYMVKYLGDDTKIVLPDYEQGKKYEIWQYAFYNVGNRIELQEVIIPDCVTNINNRAFFSCSFLTSVTIGDCVTNIAEKAFYGCSSLKKIILGNSVTSIGKDAFSNCTSLESITIPNSVTSIGISAFDNCTSLESIIISNSVTQIAKQAFNLCKLLTNITFEGTVEEWDNITKGDKWNYRVPATEVICSNGTVNLE